MGPKAGEQWGARRGQCPSPQSEWMNDPGRCTIKEEHRCEYGHQKTVQDRLEKWRSASKGLLHMKIVVQPTASTCSVLRVVTRDLSRGYLSSSSRLLFSIALPSCRGDTELAAPPPCLNGWARPTGAPEHKSHDKGMELRSSGGERQKTALSLEETRSNRTMKEMF